MKRRTRLRSPVTESLLTVAPTCRVKGHAEVELTLYCGDGKNRGLVQYWHTPFGELQTPGFQSELDPVFMRQDGSLVVPNSSDFHSGLYYCLLQHSEGATLWPYELHIMSASQQNQDYDEYEQSSSSSSCHQLRVRRDAEFEEEEEETVVTEQQFAGAVAASVLLTFVVGFSTGALTRTHVLRCFRAFTAKVRSTRRQQCQSGTPDHGSEVSMATLPPTYVNKAFAMGQEQNDVTTETATPSTSSNPPDKPRRSFRLKRDEEQETPAYLEGCDYEEEMRKKEEELRGRQSLRENQKGCEEEDRDLRGFYKLEDDGQSQTEREEQRDSEDGESRDEMKECEQEEGGGRQLEQNQKWCEEEDVQKERETRGFNLLKDDGWSETETEEERHSEDGESRVFRQEEEEVANEQVRRREDGEESRGKEQEEGNKEKVRDYEEENVGEKGRQQSSDMDDEETGTKHDVMKGKGSSSSPGSARRSRVIRLYQYDEEGQRYSHLPDPSSDDPAPAPRLKQRSLSLTRLNTIMAAASAGPLDRGETEREDGEGRLHFHMEI
ncbi:cyclin-dependent kinase 11B isoform X2 [Solea solea]|uniref:cyclin-dependent kinase 11B isoform X2 n=1 Tax=Solea solea TaxID=90069 RepID=UPI002729ACDE|nr:cyclin-dependent kinase 11B isoform X2 [Solea solea]